MTTLKKKRKKGYSKAKSGREVILATSLLATGSGGAMLGAMFSPVGALIGGLAGTIAAYVVEQKNLAEH